MSTSEFDSSSSCELELEDSDVDSDVDSDADSSIVCFCLLFSSCCSFLPVRVNEAPFVGTDDGFGLISFLLPLFVLWSFPGSFPVVNPGVGWLIVLLLSRFGDA